MNSLSKMETANKQLTYDFDLVKYNAIGIIEFLKECTGFEFAGGALFHIGDYPEVTIIFYDPATNSFYSVENYGHLPDVETIKLKLIDFNEHRDLTWLYRPNASLVAIITNQFKELSKRINSFFL